MKCESCYKTTIEACIQRETKGKIVLFFISEEKKIVRMCVDLEKWERDGSTK